jgi:hypothetical protein
MIILRANKVNLFASSVLFVFWYHSPNVLDTPHICNVSRVRVKLYDQDSPQYFLCSQHHNIVPALTACEEQWEQKGNMQWI